MLPIIEISTREGHPDDIGPRGNTTTGSRDLDGTIQVRENARRNGNYRRYRYKRESGENRTGKTKWEI